MIKIGDFSKLSQVSVKTLRYYDQIGLLKPVHVDRFSGYRYYSVDQLPRLNRILALKDLNFSLEQIAGLLDDSLTPEQMRGMLRLKQAEIERQLQDEGARLARVEARLRQIEQERKMPEFEVVIKKVDPFTAATIRDVLPNYGSLGELLGEAFSELGRLGVSPAGPPLAIYHDHEYREQDVDIEVVLPIAETTLPDHERLKFRQVPGEESMASMIMKGSYEGFTAAYQDMMSWIITSGYEIGGPNREIYLRGPESGPDTSTYLTEIQFPLKKA